MIMRLARLRERSNTGGLGAKQACAVQKQFARVSVIRMFVTRASPVKCDSVAHIKRLHV